jgi:hypothetical protein
MTTLILLGLMAGAPVADVWPWKVERLPDGSYEYTYDLAPLEAVRGSADARHLHGADAVDAFVKGLPKSAKVRVVKVAGVLVAAGRGGEPRPLASRFSAVSDAPVRSGNPLERQAGPLLRMPLHPEEPKVLLSADVALWAARGVEEAAQNAVLLALAAQRKALFEGVLAKALQRTKGDEGDGREGAVALSARLAAALSCLDAARIPAGVRAFPQVATAAARELQKLSAQPDARAVPRPFAASPALSCAYTTTWVASQPLEAGRAANAAVLTFLSLVERDPQLKRRYWLIRQRRDDYLGRVAFEPIDLWRTVAGADSEGAIVALAEFLEKLPFDQRVAPPLLAAPVTPFAAFREQLSARERSSSVEELAAAVADGRVDVTARPETPWPAVRESALAPLLVAEAPGVQFDAFWRDRLLGTFASMVGGHHDSGGEGPEREPLAEERSELKVRLMVPPHLDAEPVGHVFAAQAASLERLGQQLTTDKLGGLPLLYADGRVGPELAGPEVARWARLLNGLALLASPEVRALSSPEVKAARALVADWRRDGAANKDVRGVSVQAFQQGDERLHTVSVGVARREIAVTFSSPPVVSGVPEGPFVVDSTAEQRYVVPVLKTVGVVLPAAQLSAPRNTVLRRLDAVGGDPLQVEGAVLEALSPPR